MAVTTPRAPVWLVCTGAVGWVVFTAVAVSLKQDDAGGVWRGVAEEAAATVAGVGAAAVIGGGILELWRRSEWRRRTRWVAYNLTERAMRALARTAAQARQIGLHVNGIEPRDAPPWDPRLFTFPFTAENRNQVEATASLFNPQGVDAAHARASHAINTPTGAAPEAHQTAGVPTSGAAGIEAGAAGGYVLTRVLLEMDAEADRLWSVATELSGYLDDIAGPALLTHAGELVRAVHSVVDPMPGTELMPEITTLFAYASYDAVLTGCADLAEELDHAHQELKSRFNPEELAEGPRRSRRRPGAPRFYQRSRQRP